MVTELLTLLLKSVISCIPCHMSWESELPSKKATICVSYLCFAALTSSTDLVVPDSCEFFTIARLKGCILSFQQTAESV